MTVASLFFSSSLLSFPVERMSTLNRREALICGALATPFLTAPVPADSSALDKGAVDGIVHNALKAWEVPGVALGIVRHGEVVHLQGYGVRELGKPKPITLDTLFAIASCTKAFTTTAMAMLVDEGKMHWDDPVRNYLESFRLADPSADRLVTLRDLVCHRTGLGSHDLLWYRAPWDQKEAIRRIGWMPPSLPFRSSFQYQSTMVAAAGYAVQAASGMRSWEEFIQKRIFDPLEMDNCNFLTAHALSAPDHATPHRRNRQDRIEPISWYKMATADPAGSINASARDLCKWALFQLGDGTVSKAGKKVRLVSEAGLEETHSPQNPMRLSGYDRQMQPDCLLMSYGMAWVIQDHRGHLLISHAGTIDGFRTHITLAPNAGLGIVLLNNLHGTDLNLAISNSILDLVLGLPPKDWNACLGKVARARDDMKKAQRQQREAKRFKGTRPSRELDAYVGDYYESVFGHSQITLDQGKLVWHWSSFHCPLEHFHFDTFLARSEILDDPAINFSLGTDGQVVTLNAVERYFLRVAK
jgi:CubicO group peptidase (beta-lactamase class C family)